MASLTRDLAVSMRQGARRMLRRTVVIGGGSLLLAGALSVAPTMAFARRNGYAWQTEIVLAEILIVPAFLLAGLATAHWAIQRTSRPRIGRGATVEA